MHSHPAQEQNFTTLEALRTYHQMSFIRSAYRSIVGREVDPTDLDDLLSQLRQQLSPAGLLTELRCITGSLVDFVEQASVDEAFDEQTGKHPILEPMSSLRPDESGNHSWHSEGNDPWFLWSDICQKLRPGWYMIELCLHSQHTHNNVAKLYFDYGDGYHEAFSVILPFHHGQLARRLYYLESSPRQVRFDPLERTGQFSVIHLDLVPVSSTLAHRHMLLHIQHHHVQYKDYVITRIWRALAEKAKATKATADALLYQDYNQSLDRGVNKNYIAASYTDWISKYETPEYSDPTAILTAQQSFKFRPTISIVMPVYDTTASFLRQAIESVLAQSYPDWELCIADDASSQPHIRILLEAYSQQDSRIKAIFRAENGHIAAASNSALTLATGEYVALLDHDDELAPHALHFMVQAINQHPAAQIFYSDEDKIDMQGNRQEPHFKPDWNPDLFFSQNYISHLSVYRHALLQRIGGFRLGVEGSQDQDLLLRCLLHVKPNEIIHIPKILYHWRIAEGSTALHAAEKNYTTTAGIKALRHFFDIQGRNDIQIEAGIASNTYRVRYPLPQPEPLVSLLIPTRDKLELLEPCIRSILDKTTYQNYQIIILDNESTESTTLDFFQSIQNSDARVSILPYHQSFNYSAINNYGVQQAKGELIGLINNDVEVINPEWLSEMVSHALRPEIGCVGAKLYYDDETIQHAGVITGLGGVAGHSHKYFPRTAAGYFNRLKIIQNLSAVTAACLIVRKTIYEEVGGLEETHLHVAFNDVDFCLKVREAGYRNLWTPYAELYHFESKSRGEEDTPEKVARFNKEIEYIKTRWGATLLADPCYSPNLTLVREDFSIGD